MKKNLFVAMALFIAGPARGAGEVWSPFIMDQVAPFSGGALGGNVTLPVNGTLAWSTRGQLSSPVDGQVKISKADGTVTTGSSALLFGNQQSLVYDATYGLRSMSANQSANSGFAGLQFVAVANGGFFGMPTTSGMTITSSTALDLRTNSTVGLAIDSAQVVTVSQAKLAVGTCLIYAGSGSPEGVLTAPICSLWLRTDGGASTTLYVKQSGVGNTGWVAK
jgi:hypothetical protein